MKRLMFWLLIACTCVVACPPVADLEDSGAIETVDVHALPPHLGAAFARQIFTAGGTFTAPGSVTKVIVCGFGAGGGGGGGGTASALNSTTGGGGGGGAVQACGEVDVTPNTGYTVTIGAGGTSGAAEAIGGAGGDTSFGSTLIAFSGGSGGGAGLHSTIAVAGPGGGAFIKRAGAGVACVVSGLITSTNSVDLAVGPCGGRGGSSVINNATTNPGIIGDQGWFASGGSITNGGAAGAAGGAGSTTDVPGAGGGGGGAGPNGPGSNGGNGGNGNTGGAGVAGQAGTSSPSNSGAGGGGGGGGGIGTTTSGTGGAGGVGGSGELWVIYPGG